MTDYGEELDAIVDEHRERVREVREQLIDFGAIDDSIAAAVTEAENERIRDFQRDLRVSWVWPERDWRGNPYD
jgi:hypothetical protein